jgi:hypothetical protein
VFMLSAQALWRGPCLKQAGMPSNCVPYTSNGCARQAGLLHVAFKVMCNCALGLVRADWQ